MSKLQIQGKRYGFVYVDIGYIKKLGWKKGDELIYNVLDDKLIIEKVKL